MARHTAHAKTGPIEQYVREGFRTERQSLESATARLLLATKRVAFQLTEERTYWVDASEADRKMAIAVIFDHFHLASADIDSADKGLLATTNKAIEYDPENRYSDVRRDLVREFASWLAGLQSVA